MTLIEFIRMRELPKMTSYTWEHGIFLEQITERGYMKTFYSVDDFFVQVTYCEDRGHIIGCTALHADEYLECFISIDELTKSLNKG